MADPNTPASGPGRAPLLLASAANLLILGWLYAYTARDIGRFTYPLDDAYIHMGMARTLAETCTWGINPVKSPPLRRHHCGPCSWRSPSRSSARASCSPWQ